MQADGARIPVAAIGADQGSGFDLSPFLLLAQ